MVSTVLYNWVYNAPSNVLRQGFYFPGIKLLPVFALHISSTRGFLFSGRWREQPKWHHMINVLQIAAPQKYYNVTRIFEPQTKI